MSEKQEPINQTQFSFEEPIFENEATYSEKPLAEVTDKPKSKKKLFIFVIVGFFIVVFFLVILLVRNGKPSPEELAAEPASIPMKELGPLQQRIQDARDLLNLADPTKQDLTFPPVDLNIRLDPRER